MNDRELLEMAAKAAGIHIDKSPYNGGGLGNTGFDMLGSAVLDWHNYKTWNPLASDGDALRLAVKLRLEIERSKHSECVVYVGEVGAGQLFERSDEKTDIFAATRRAIVRAAAEIGRAIKE